MWRKKKSFLNVYEWVIKFPKNNNTPGSSHYQYSVTKCLFIFYSIKLYSNKNKVRTPKKTSSYRKLHGQTCIVPWYRMIVPCLLIILHTKRTSSLFWCCNFGDMTTNMKHVLTLSYGDNEHWSSMQNKVGCKMCLATPSYWGPVFLQTDRAIILYQETMIVSSSFKSTYLMGQGHPVILTCLQHGVCSFSSSWWECRTASTPEDLLPLTCSANIPVYLCYCCEGMPLVDWVACARNLDQAELWSEK